MFRPVEFYIGLRYTHAKRSNHFISFISLTSMLGIALGITALITVLSVMNGFQEELRERILSMTAHATVSGAQGRLSGWREVSSAALEHPAVTAAAPYVRAEAMLMERSRVSGAVVQGILPERERGVSELASSVVAGDLNRLAGGEYGIVLGRELANILGAWVGDKVTVVAPQVSITPAGVMPRLRRFEVIAVFGAGMYEYDRGLAFVHLEDAARLFDLDGAVSGIRLRLEDMFQAPRVVQEIARGLAGGHRVSDWTREHANFFRAVQIEKTAMFVILMLIVAVAAFNIVSTLVMVVTDKRSDIAILRTLGAARSSIMGVFIVQGVTIGVVGTLAGLAGGVALALNVETVVPALEQMLGIKFLAPDVYLITDLPSELRWGDVATIGTVAFSLAVLATLYPAWRAARTPPAEALRYE